MTDLTYTPGQMKTYLGYYVNLADPDPETLHPGDVAWGLGRIIRFNGMIAQDYTVAHHCLVMSHYVPEQYALEALLHDAAEAYMGDIIWPVKAWLDERTDNAVSNFENRFVARLMYHFGSTMGVEEDSGGPIYVKSDVVRQADKLMGQHEWAILGRGDEFETDDDVQAAFDFVNQYYEEDFSMPGQPWWAWLRRFHELTNTEYDYEGYVKLFFPETTDKDLSLTVDEKIDIEFDEARRNLGISDEEWADILSKADEIATYMVSSNDN